MSQPTHAHDARAGNGAAYCKILTIPNPDYPDRSPLGNTWEYFDDLFQGKQTESWKMWFPSMAAAALFTGLLVDQKMVDKTTMLCVSLPVLTVAQGIFSMATVDESMSSTDTNWPNVPHLAV